MENLIPKLNANPLDATDSDVIALITQMRNEAPLGLSKLDIDKFYQPGDIEAFKQAHLWWPKDCNPRHKLYLSEVCRFIYYLPGKPPVATTFQEGLMHWTNIVVAWLEANNRYVANPNETPNERRARKARERQAKFRAEKKADNPELSEVKQLHAKYIQLCSERKAAAAAYDERVDAAKAAWEAAKLRLES